MTPKFRIIIFQVYHTTKNVGIHFLLVCHLRLTTALSADEQSDTHASYCLYTRKCAMKAWLAFMHTTGIHVQHSRGIILCIAFDQRLIVVISDDQSTKHHVTLFYYVVHIPTNLFLLLRQSGLQESSSHLRGLLRCKCTNNYQKQERIGRNLSTKYTNPTNCAGIIRFLLYKELFLTMKFGFWPNTTICRVSLPSLSTCKDAEL